MTSYRAESVAERVQRLALEIASLRRGTEQQASMAPELISTGVVEWDALLPRGGVAPGCLVEWLGEPGAGAGALGAFFAARACGQERWLVVVDAYGELYPLGLQVWGVDLERTVFVRPACFEEGLWALDAALRAEVVGAVLGVWGRLDERSSRRIQLAAEANRKLAVLLRPGGARWEPSWAEVRWFVEPVASAGWGSRRTVRVELWRCRGMIEKGGHVELELDYETGAVRVASPVASTTVVTRTPAAGVRIAGAL